MPSAPILLTGATGVLGIAITRKLLAEGHALRAVVRNVETARRYLPSEVEVLEGTLQDVVALDTALRGCRACVHMAGLVSFDKADQQTLLETNYEGTRNLVNACLQEGIGHLVHISSIAAIPQALADEQTVSRPGQHYSYYGYTKRLAELEVRRGEAEGLPFTILRPSVVVGAHPDKRSSSAMFRLAARPQSAVPPGIIHWVSVDDVADAVAAALQRGPEDRIWLLDAEPTTWVSFFETYRRMADIQGSLLKVSRLGLKLAAPFAGLFAALTGLPIPGRRQLLNFLKDTPYPDRNQAEQLLGHPYRTLTEALKQVVQS